MKRRCRQESEVAGERMPVQEFSESNIASTKTRVSEIGSLTIIGQYEIISKIGEGGYGHLPGGLPLLERPPETLPKSHGPQSVVRSYPTYRRNALSSAVVNSPQVPAYAEPCQS